MKRVRKVTDHVPRRTGYEVLVICEIGLIIIVYWFHFSKSIVILLYRILPGDFYISGVEPRLERLIWGFDELLFGRENF